MWYFPKTCQNIFVGNKTKFKGETITIVPINTGVTGITYYTRTATLS